MSVRPSRNQREPLDHNRDTADALYSRSAAADTYFIQPPDFAASRMQDGQANAGKR